MSIWKQQLSSEVSLRDDDLMALGWTLETLADEEAYGMIL